MNQMDTTNDFYKLLCKKCSRISMIKLFCENNQLFVKSICNCTEKDEIYSYNSFISIQPLNNSNNCKYCLEKDLSVNGKLYCFQCQKWLCDSCLSNHDQSHSFYNYTFKFELTCNCDKKGKITTFCIDCSKHLCDECSLMHSPHSLVQFCLYSPKEIVYSRVDNFCKHKSEKMKYYEEIKDDLLNPVLKLENNTSLVERIENSFNLNTEICNQIYTILELLFKLYKLIHPNNNYNLVTNLINHTYLDNSLYEKWNKQNNTYDDYYGECVNLFHYLESNHLIYLNVKNIGLIKPIIRNFKKKSIFLLQLLNSGKIFLLYKDGSAALLNQLTFEVESEFVLFEELSQSYENLSNLLKFNCPNDKLIFMSKFMFPVILKPENNKYVIETDLMIEKVTTIAVLSDNNLLCTISDGLPTIYSGTNPYEKIRDINEPSAYHTTQLSKGQILFLSYMKTIKISIWNKELTKSKETTIDYTIDSLFELPNNRLLICSKKLMKIMNINTLQIETQIRYIFNEEIIKSLHLKVNKNYFIVYIQGAKLSLCEKKNIYKNCGFYRIQGPFTYISEMIETHNGFVISSKDKLGMIIYKL